MKTTKKLLVLLIMTGLLFNSCSITKRRYMPGYYVHHSQQNKQSNRTAENNKAIVCSPATPESQTLANKTKKEGNNSPTNKNVANNSKQKKHQTKKEIKTKAAKRVVHINNGTKEEKVTRTNNLLLQKRINPSFVQTQPQSNIKQDIVQDTDEPNSALKTIGWVLITLGFLVLLFASILAGVLLLLLGLIFVVSA